MPLPRHAHRSTPRTRDPHLHENRRPGRDPALPELRNCPAPSAPRILEIFDDLARHQLINADDDIVQTYQPQLSDLQQQVLDLLHIPASIYNQT